MTNSRPTSAATALRPAGLISRELPIPKRSAAIKKVWPLWTRLRKSGMRRRKAPSIERPSRVSRLSETQSSDGVIWSVSMAANFLPGFLRVPKIKAWPADQVVRGGLVNGAFRNQCGGLDARKAASPLRNGGLMCSSHGSVFLAGLAPPFNLKHSGRRIVVANVDIELSVFSVTGATGRGAGRQSSLLWFCHSAAPGSPGDSFFLLNKFIPENHRKKKSDLSRQERWKFRFDAAREAVASGNQEKARKHWLRAVYHGQKIGHESQELRQAEEGLEALACWGCRRWP